MARENHIIKYGCIDWSAKKDIRQAWHVHLVATGTTNDKWLFSPFESIFKAFAEGMPSQVSKVVRFPSESIKRRKSCNTSSHIALVPVLFLGQLFGIMPVLGIATKSAKRLKFTWLNLRVLHTTLLMFGQITMVIVSVKWAACNKISIPILEPVIWFGTKFLLMGHFLWLARQWPSLMVEWESIEQTLPMYVSPKENVKFFSHIKWLAILLSVSFFMEHTLSVAVGISRMNLCSNDTSMELFFKHAWPQIYTSIRYNGAFLGLLLELLNYYCTFQWTFMDIFMISISICLSTRFNQLTEHLLQFQGMKMPTTFWINQRQRFTTISTLVDKIDDKISIIAAYSVTSNLFYILIQLLHSFQPQSTSIEAFYFWFSLLFLVFRTVLVSLTAAKINDESRRPAKVLRSIPHDGYDKEANRFLEQVVNSKVGLTGMRFFYFTRPLMLTVIGTIITYELVLVQFQVITPKTKENICDGFE